MTARPAFGGLEERPDGIKDVRKNIRSGFCLASYAISRAPFLHALYRATFAVAGAG